MSRLPYSLHNHRHLRRCGLCGREASVDELEIHHLVGVSTAPGLAFILKNLLLVCRDCHRSLHEKC